MSKSYETNACSCKAKSDACGCSATKQECPCGPSCNCPEPCACEACKCGGSGR